MLKFEASHLPVIRYQPLVLVALAIVAGILADRYLGSHLGGLGLFLWWTLALASVAICYWLIRTERFNLSSIVLLTAFATLSAAWHHDHWNYLQHNHLARYAELQSEPVCVQAVAVGRTQWSPAPAANPLTSVPQSSSSTIEVELTGLRNGSDWQNITGKCRLRVFGELSGIERGDRLLAFAQFGRPRPAMNPGQYDWAAAQRGEGKFVDMFCRVPQCVSIDDDATTSEPGRIIDHVAYWCERQVTRYVDEDDRNLALALMLGQRERLPDDQFEEFLRTGTVHLLVVSGLHVGFLAMSVWLLVRMGMISQRGAIVATAIAVLLYAMVVGARPPVTRAAILVMVGLTALTVGRRALRWNLLAAAAIIVLAISPSELFRGGTQLSFLCVAAIAVYVSLSKRWNQPNPLQQLIEYYKPPWRKAIDGGRRWLIRMVIVSLVIWITTAPLVAYHFHMSAPISAILTPLIWLAVAISLMAEFALCAVGWLLPPVGYLLGGLISTSLGFVSQMVSWADSWEIGRFYTAGPAWWWLLGLYSLLGWFVFLQQRQFRWQWQAAAVALWISVGFGSATLNRNSDELHCTFLSVGHGTCVVLELPEGQTVLYDAGSLGSPESASRTIAAYLWSRGISHVNSIVLSHADIDHYNAMPGLIERFSIDNVYVSPLMFDPWATQGQLTAPNYLKGTLTAAKIPLQEVWLNDRMKVSSPQLEIDFLHPPRTGVIGRDNANSLVLRVQYAGKVILLPGDLESPGIEAVMAEPALDCEILLAPHHGSVRSDPPGFAAWCTPEWVVVSGRDSGNADDLTTASYREVGAELLHTSRRGSASFTVFADEEKPLHVTTFH